MVNGWQPHKVGAELGGAWLLYGQGVALRTLAIHPFIRSKILYMRSR